MVKKASRFWDTPPGILVVAVVIGAVPLGGLALVVWGSIMLAVRMTSRGRATDAAEELPLSPLGSGMPGDFVRVRGTIATPSSFKAPMSEASAAVVQQALVRDAGMRWPLIWSHVLGKDLELTSEGDSAKVTLADDTELVTDLLVYECKWSSER